MELEVVAATDTMQAAVAALAVLGGGEVRGLHERADRAREAVARLRTADLRRAGGDVPRAVRRLVRRAAGAAPQSVTVQHRAALGVEQAATLHAQLAKSAPDLEVVLLGPVEDGPAWRVGVD